MRLLRSFPGFCSPAATPPFPGLRPEMSPGVQSRPLVRSTGLHVHLWAWHPHRNPLGVHIPSVLLKIRSYRGEDI